MFNNKEFLMGISNDIRNLRWELDEVKDENARLRRRMDGDQAHLEAKIKQVQDRQTLQDNRSNEEVTMWRKDMHAIWTRYNDLLAYLELEEVQQSSTVIKQKSGEDNGC